MAQDQPDARAAWEVIYLDFRVITHDREVIEQAQAGDFAAQYRVVSMLDELSRDHLRDLDGKLDPLAPIRRGLTIKRVA